MKELKFLPMKYITPINNRDYSPFPTIEIGCQTRTIAKEVTEIIESIVNSSQKKIGSLHHQISFIESESLKGFAPIIKIIYTGHTDDIDEITSCITTQIGYQTGLEFIKERIA